MTVFLRSSNRRQQPYNVNIAVSLLDIMAWDRKAISSLQFT